MKTAMQELIEKYKALPEPLNPWSKNFINAAVKDMEGQLEKEKEQIKNAHEAGTKNGIGTGEFHFAEYYYNKTYNHD